MKILSNFKRFKKINKTLFAILLSSNLILLSTGSAELNTSTSSADLESQATLKPQVAQVQTLTLRPNGAGLYTEFSTQFPNTGAQWDKVGEDTPDEDATYIESPTGTIQRSIFVYPPSGIPAGSSIAQIAVFFRGRTVGVGSHELHAAVRIGGLDFEGSVPVMSTSYANFSQVWTTNPATNSPWTTSEIDNLQFGVRAGFPHQVAVRATQVWMVVTYNTSGATPTPAPAPTPTPTPAPTPTPTTTKIKADPTGSFVEDELVVKFKDGVSDSKKQNIISSYGAYFILEELNLVKSKTIKVDPQKREKIKKVLKKNPNVEYVEPSSLMKSQLFHPLDAGLFSIQAPSPSNCFPNDFYFCQGVQWGLEKAGVLTGWLSNKGSSSFAVAVLDTGVDYNHYDLSLSPSGRVVKGPDIVNLAEFPWDPMDEHGHGTQVASIIGALTNNSSGIAGVDWNARILAIRTSTGGLDRTAWFAQGIREVANFHPEVKVINISFATTLNDSELRNAVSEAQAAGKRIVASAINSSAGQTNCFMGFPAAYSGVISVVATNQNDQHSSGCTGKVSGGQTFQQIQVAAPGTDIFTLQRNSGIGYNLGSFTSYATPFVSGVLSILSTCSSTPYLDLIQGVDDLGPAGWDSTFGYGRINLFNSLNRTCF